MRIYAVFVQSLIKSWYEVAIVTLLAMLPTLGSAQPVPASQPTPEVTQGSVLRGEALFIGRARFRNEAPACVSCHSIAGLSFPYGGTLGPDLTDAYTKLGQEGIETALQTLYFPTMAPIYGERPLVPEEQADMVAFMKQAETKPQSQWTTQILILAALLLSSIFVALTGFFWRDRVRSVRRSLIDRATRQGGRF